MPLNAQEMKQLKALQAKANEPTKPLTEDDLCKMEETVAAATGVSADFMQAATDAWSGYWHKVLALASDNAKLITEIRRMSANHITHLTVPYGDGDSD